MNIEQRKEAWIKRGFSFRQGTFKKDGRIVETCHRESDEVVFIDKGNVYTD